MIDLDKIKGFAEVNFCLPEKEQVYADDPEFAVTNPWIDHSGRYSLTDEEAVNEWGLKTVLEFCEKAQKKIDKEEKAVLCGFVFCHGKRDFSVCEMELEKQDAKIIESVRQQPAACRGWGLN